MDPRAPTPSDDADDEAATRIADAQRDEQTRTPSDAALMDAAPEPQAQAHVDPHAWFLGRSFGGFRALCAIASSGMASVFLARKEGPSRVSKYAAVKVVHPHLASEPEFVNTFLDEARNAAVLDHPNVCRVIDVGMAEGTYYLAMEYLLGETWSSVRSALAARPDAERVLPTISAYVLSQACEGLHAAHEAVDEQGRPLHIVHRGISPQNIFVAYDGTVRVLDFGVARAADRITSTRGGAPEGRVAYMSPEQLSGLAVGASADIWAMGVVLREALENKRLFQRATKAETTLAVTHEPLPPWSVEVPAALRAIADRALSRAPLERFASAHEMASELWRFAQSARTPIGSSELSAWMGLSFSQQLEQKRAQLQLPVPLPIADTALPGPSVLPPESNPGTHSLSTPFAPLHVPRRGSPRPRRFNTSALIALASVGAIAGLVLGRVFRSQRAAPPQSEIASQPAGAQPEDEGPPSEPTRPDPAAPPADEPAANTAALESEPPPALDPVDAPASGRAATGAAPLDRTRGRQRSRDAARSDGAARSNEDKPAPRERRAGAEPVNAPTKNAESGAAEPSARGEAGVVAVAFDGGWAEVYLGTRLLGTTPGRFTLPAGKHTLTVRPFGTGKPLIRRVEIAPGATQKLFLGPSSP